MSCPCQLSPPPTILLQFFYLGLWQYQLYSVYMPRLALQVARKWGERATAPVLTLVDQGLHHPFMYFPAYYALRVSEPPIWPCKLQLLHSARRAMFLPENLLGIIAWFPNA
jgi:hypothetical protein